MINSQLTSASNIMLGTTQVSALYIGSTLVWQAQQQQGELPSGYTQLEYIKSTASGGQYIDLNCQLFANTDGITIWTKFQWLGAGVDNQNTRCIFNGMEEIDPYPGFVIYQGGTNNIKIANDNTDNKDTFVEVGRNTIYESPDTGFFVGNPKSTKLHNVSSTVFCSLDGNGNPFRFTEMRLYYLKIQKGNTIIRDMVPVTTNDNKVGMYDKISRTLFESLGTNAFEAGPVEVIVTLPAGYTKLKYISSTSTGGQYIDLDIKLYETLNTNYDIAIKFMIIGQGLNNTTNAAIFACQNNSSPWPGTFIRKTSSTNNIVGRYIGGTAKDNTIGQTNNIIELPVQISPNKNVTNLSNGGNTHNFGTSLFCTFSDTNNTATNFTEGRIYYFKLFVEGVLVRNMIPCINPNNVVGLYDAVNDVFYSSPNGAAFVAGY